ncbi:male-specific lethal 3 homolog isoform X2 [Folsomia candida]|uniref:male-specific lethal 3 homolog isoform X2 n=1 Tax=Folsomia candida TaxID=158441 RepID=UPI000B903CF9|nr:male-specific lethal 3 homolog isoform X2 [Folsomia candida]
MKTKSCSDNSEKELMLRKHCSKKKKKKKISIKEKIQAVTVNASNIKKEGKTKGKGNNKGQHTTPIIKQERDLTDYDSSEEEGELVRQSEQLVIPEELKKILEYDWNKVRNRTWLIKLPSRITVIDLLEEYIRFSAKAELRSYIAKVEHLQALMTQPNVGYLNNVMEVFPPPVRQTPSLNAAVNDELIKTLKRITFRRIVVQDVRLMFDSLLSQILLFQNENDQYDNFLAGHFSTPVVPVPDLVPELIITIKTEPIVEDDPDDLIIQNVIKRNMPPPPVPPLKRKTRSLGGNSSENKSSDVKAGPSRKSTPPSLPSQTIFAPSTSGSASFVDPTTPLVKATSLRYSNDVGEIEMIPLSQIKTEPLDNDEPVQKQRKFHGAKIVYPSEEDDDKSKIPILPESLLMRASAPIPTSAVFSKEKFCCELEDKCKFPWACRHLNEFMDELYQYQLLPPSEMNSAVPYPSMCYGMQHLLRLFVKMPEVLSRTAIPRRKMGSIVEEMNSILRYFTTIRGIVTRNDWYKTGAATYEEDYITESNCHLFAGGTPSRKLLKKSTKEHRKKSKGKREKEKHKRVKTEPSRFSSKRCLAKPGTATLIVNRDRMAMVAAMKKQRFLTPFLTVKKEQVATPPPIVKKKESTVTFANFVTVKKEPSVENIIHQESAPIATSSKKLPKSGGGELVDDQDGKRNSRRRLSGKVDDAVLNSGATIVMGVRKSFGREDLSRETSVGPTTTPPPAPAATPSSSKNKEAKPSYSLRHHRPSYK